MLTKDDLAQIGKVLDQRLIAERENTKTMIDEELDEKLTPIKKELRSIRKTQKTMLNLLDTKQMRQRKAINCLEKKLGLPPLPRG